MIEIKWSQQASNTVVWTFTAPWTFEEFYDTKLRVDAMIDSVEGIVDSIFLTTPEQKLPPRAVTHLRNIVAQQHKRHRYIVVVGAKTFLSTLINVITKLVPNADLQFHFVCNQSKRT